MQPHLRTLPAKARYQLRSVENSCRPLSTEKRVMARVHQAYRARWPHGATRCPDVPPASRRTSGGPEERVCRSDVVITPGVEFSVPPNSAAAGATVARPVLNASRFEVIVFDLVCLESAERVEHGRSTRRFPTRRSPRSTPRLRDCWRSFR